MGNIRKTCALLLTLIITVSCLTVLMMKPVTAQPTTSKLPIPQTPQFSLKIEDGYVVISIKNQNYPNGTLYYDVRTRVHSSDNNWVHYREMYHYADGLFDCPKQTSTEFTVLRYSYNDLGYPDSYPANSTIDVQVQAIPQGTISVFVLRGPLPGEYEAEYATGDPSGWSNSQTIMLSLSIPDPGTMPPMQQTASPRPLYPITSPEPTLTPNALQSTTPFSELDNGYPSISLLLLTNNIALLIIALLLGVIITLLLVIRKRKIAY
jgi:hypothetical protein